LLRVFTAWGNNGVASLFIEGEGPPRFSDGTLIDPGCEKIWRIEANTINEGMSKYHELQGWEPYSPVEGLDDL
jgi:hypothetical protein